MVAFRRRRRSIPISVTQKRENNYEKIASLAVAKIKPTKVQVHTAKVLPCLLGRFWHFIFKWRTNRIELCGGMRKRNDIEYEIGARPTIESPTNSIIIQ